MDCTVRYVSRSARPKPGPLGQAVAARLRAELFTTGLSQRQFAPIVGVSDSQLSKLLRGEVEFTLGLLDITCQELGLSIVEVIDAADFETRNRGASS